MITIFKNFPNLSISKGIKIQFNCEKCGKPVLYVWPGDKRASHRTHLCKSCSSKIGAEASLKHNRQWQFDGLQFDSSWELAFYIYHKDHNHSIKRLNVFEKEFFYQDENRQKRSFTPDFEVESQLYEIKGNHLLNGKTRESTLKKLKLCKENNIIVLMQQEIQFYLDYVTNTYSKNYLDQFKIKKRKSNGKPPIHNVPHTEAAKQKMREHTKKRAILCVETGIIYGCPGYAAAALNQKHGSNIFHGIKKNRVAYGFHWKYAD